MKNVHHMSSTLSALAEPKRLRIIEQLRRSPRSVGEIARELGLRQPQASKHLRVLSEAGLVEVHQAAQRRIYVLRPQPFRELDGWLEPYRSMWKHRLDRLDDLLSVMKKEGMNHGKGR
jgi:DNA-binding transcriptional ArsR family regulator